jgi:1,3-beta-glucan synthase
MITGYKKKKLGKPSEKLSGDVPRAGWRAVIVSEVLFPIFFAILLIIAYMFVKSFPVAGQTSPSPLIRIVVVSIGPIVWNAAVLLVLFLVSLFLGPMLDSCCVRFGAVMATFAHILGTIGMIGFFEFFVSLPSHLKQLCFLVLNACDVVAP